MSYVERQASTPFYRHHHQKQYLHQSTSNGGTVTCCLRSSLPTSSVRSTTLFRSDRSRSKAHCNGTCTSDVSSLAAIGVNVASTSIVGVDALAAASDASLTLPYVSETSSQPPQLLRSLTSWPLLMPPSMVMNSLMPASSSQLPQPQSLLTCFLYVTATNVVSVHEYTNSLILTVTICASKQWELYQRILSVNLFC